MTDAQKRREELYSLLGDLPERDRPVSAETVAVEELDGYILEKLLLDLNGIELAPAHFVKPKESDTPLPTILYNHAHGGDYVLGKDEMTCGRSALQQPPYAVALTRAGYNALCVDTWAFGERRGRSESEIFKEMLWRGQVMWGMMVYDSIKAVDYLAWRDDVDAERIGTMGISMGSTMSWWVAALDERIKVCVDLCCLTEFEALIETRGLDGHGIYYYVPKLLKHFRAAEINELICPRAHLSLAGNYDRLTPPAGLTRIDNHLRKAYAEAGRPDRWELVRYNTGHFENADMRRRVLESLTKHL